MSKNAKAKLRAIHQKLNEKIIASFKGTKVERLCEKLTEKGFTCHPRLFRRLYPGRHQQNAGVWSWVIWDDKGLQIGSPDPVTELLRYGFIIQKNRFSGEWECISNR